MTKIQAYFPDEMYLNLKIRAKQEKINFSELLRKLAGDYLETKPNKKVNQLTNFPKFEIKNSEFEGLKSEEVSKKIDDIVYGK